MNANNKTMKMILTGLFICLGLIIPYLAGHMAGIPGTVLLPMHIPVLIAGLLLGPVYGGICGVLTPIVSSLLTGMPAFWPTLPMMVCELAVYGMITGLLRGKYKRPLYLSMLTAMIAGRIVSGIIFAIITLPPGLSVVIKSVTATTVTGIPGIVIQLVLIPPLVKLLERSLGLNWDKESAIAVQDITDITINTAADKIRAGECSIVLIKNNHMIYQAKGSGIQPLLTLMETEEGRELLCGAYVVDKITGKAAAMILVLSKAAGAYALTMSKSGKDYLKQHGIPHDCDRCVDVISDRTGRGICPIERSVLEITDAEEGYHKIAETRKALMNKTS